MISVERPRARADHRDFRPSFVSFVSFVSAPPFSFVSAPPHSGSGTAGALLARADPFFKSLGPVYWLGVGLGTALAAALVLFFVKSANHKQSLADLNVALATPRNTINPLAHTFTDLIIAVEDLRLPTSQIHENKLFKRCKFVGPAAIAILGGTYVNCG